MTVLALAHRPRGHPFLILQLHLDLLVAVASEWCSMCAIQSDHASVHESILADVKYQRGELVSPAGASWEGHRFAHGGQHFWR
jgi:hypothetical protein